MAKPVEIGSRSFRSQKSALEHYQALLHRYQGGQCTSDLVDHADLVEDPLGALQIGGVTASIAESLTQKPFKRNNFMVESN
jgi:hypothetical protein